MVRNVLLKLRRDLAINWVGVVPAAGELTYATDTYTLKIGDGSTVWQSLPGLNTDQLDSNHAGAFALATHNHELAGAWSPSITLTKVSDSSFTVTDNATNQAIFAPGRPIRYSDSENWVYGIVEGYSSGTVTISGSPMTTGYVQYADMSRILQMDILIPGYYEDASDTTILLNDLGQTLRWQQGKAYLVNTRFKTRVADSSSNCQVNVTINGTAVGSAITITSTNWFTAGVALDNDINYGDEIEVTTVKGTGGDAQDLSIALTFVIL